MIAAPTVDSVRTKYILLLICLQTAWNLASALTPMSRLGWITGMIVSVAAVLAIAVFAVVRKDGLFGGLLLFGITGGLVELLADTWLVEGTGTLLYAQPEPMIWNSPAYMPLAWAAMLIEVGYLGWAVAGRWGLLRGSLFAAALGGVMIPIYESVAHGANWWIYRDTPMILYAPYYIILGEALMAAALPVLVRVADQKAWTVYVGLGVVQGFVIFGAYWIAYSLVG